MQPTTTTQVRAQNERTKLCFTTTNSISRRPGSQGVAIEAEINRRVLKGCNMFTAWLIELRERDVRALSGW